MKLVHITASMTAVAAATAAPAQSLPGPIEESGAGWRYESIGMDVVFSPEDRSMTVSGVARLRLQIDESYGPSLLLRKNSGDSDDSEVVFTTLEADNVDVSVFNEAFEPRPGVVYSSLRAEEPFTRGDVLEIEFEIAASGKRNQFVVHPEYATASWTSAWYPTPIPGPSESFGAGMLETAGEVTFDVPIAWKTVCVGDMTGRTEDGDRASETWTFPEARAIGFAAGPFDATIVDAGGRSIGMYRLSADPSTVPAQASALSDVIDAMAAKFGEYPYTRFTIAEAPDPVPGFWAASEQGFILAKPTVFAAQGGNLPLFAHEAAHAWWGNLVGTDGDGGIFLSESLSQYGAVLAIEAIEGDEAATSFMRFSRPEYISNQCARGYFGVIRDGDDKPISSIEEGGGINHTISDSKGHWVHHMLRRRIGDEIYFGTLRTLTSEYAGRSITLDGFRERMIAAAPDAGLDVFFAQWLDRTGAPVLEFDWERSGHESTAVEVTIRQTQSGEPFDLNLEIEMVGVGEPVVESVRMTDREQTFTIDAPFRTNIVRLDPNHRILRWTPEYGRRP